MKTPAQRIDAVFKRINYHRQREDLILPFFALMMGSLRKASAELVDIKPELLASVSEMNELAALDVISNGTENFVNRLN